MVTKKKSCDGDKCKLRKNFTFKNKYLNFMYRLMS